MTLLTDLGISSPREAAELEGDLGIRFNDFTPEDADTWNRQTLYLHQFANTRTFTHAARAAGVSIRHARTWQTDNTLGFNNRLEIAVLEYTEEIEVILLEQVRQPKPSPALLAMLLRAHLPEKYGPARRDSTPRDNHHDHDDNPKPETSKEDHDSLEDIRRDIQQLKHFAGLTEPPDLSPLPQGEGQGLPRTRYGGEGESVPPNRDLNVRPPIDADSKPTHALSPAPVGAGFKPAPDPSSNGSHTGDTPQHPAPSTQNLNRRQRRHLLRQQRKQRKHAPYPNTGTKQPNSHRARAPN